MIGGGGFALTESRIQVLLSQTKLGVGEFLELAHLLADLRLGHKEIAAKYPLGEGKARDLITIGSWPRSVKQTILMHEERLSPTRIIQFARYRWKNAKQLSGAILREAKGPIRRPGGAPRWRGTRQTQAPTYIKGPDADRPIRPTVGVSLDPTDIQWLSDELSSRFGRRLIIKKIEVDVVVDSVVSVEEWARQRAADLYETRELLAKWDERLGMSKQVNHSCEP